MNIRHIARGALGVAVLFFATGCDSYFDVVNPNIIEASTVDPVADGETFSRSAFQNFADAYAELAVYSGWFSTELWVGDTFPTRNEFGRRIVAETNGTYNGVWFDISRAVATGDEVVRSLQEGPDPSSDVNIARAALSAGYAVQLMAEMFCEGTIAISTDEPGPKLNTAAMLAAAVDRFTTAYNVGTANGGTEGLAIAEAALVGRARAHLQAGDLAAAAADASQVDDDFVFNIAYVDQQGTRNRLGNGVFFYSAGGSRESAVVPAAYRAQADAGDPRISYEDADRLAQDAVLQMFSQTKFPTWDSPIPLASGLEARYIEVEANRNTVEMLAFIQERRAAGDQPVYTGAVDETSLLAELMAQRSWDFWLEAKRMGDIRRHPGLVPNFIEPGDNYYKPAVGEVSDQTCWPFPFSETNANPNV